MTETSDMLLLKLIGIAGAIVVVALIILIWLSISSIIDKYRFKAKESKEQSDKLLKNNDKI